MKYSRTALGLLNAQYRSVLRKCFLINAGLFALGAIATPANAEYTTVDLSTVYPSGTANTDLDYREGIIANWDAENILIEPTGSWGVYAAGSTVTSAEPGIINLGGVDTKNVTIKGNAQPIVWAAKQGQINIEASDKISISTTGEGDMNYAVIAQNTTTPDSAAHNKYATVNIKAETVEITAPTSGVVAMSEGIVNIEGDTTITAKKAIVSRGNSVVNINTDSDEYATVINGDIVFSYDKDTSGTTVDTTVNVNLNGSDSSWTGNTVVAWDTKPDDETKLNVKNSSITLSDGATWNATEIENNDQTTDGSRYNTLNNLTVDGGNVNFKEAGAQVQIDNLKVGADGVNVTKNADSDRIEVKTTADLRNGVSDSYADVINVNDGASLYVDADASGNLDAVGGNKANIKLEGVTLLSAMDSGSTINTAGYDLSSGNAAKSLAVYYADTSTDTSGNIILGDKQSYTDLIGIEQNGNYIKAYNAADAENTSVSANLSALDNQVFENETNIAQNTADIATNADAIAQNAAAIAGKLSGEEAADYTISGKRGSALAENIATYVAANGTKFADVQNTANIITDLFNDKAAYIQETTGMDPEHSVAYNYNQSSEELLHGATSMLNADEKLAGAIAKRKVTVDATTGIASITDGTTTANVYTKEAAEAIFTEKQQWG